MELVTGTPVSDTPDLEVATLFDNENYTVLLEQFVFDDDFPEVTCPEWHGVQYDTYYTVWNKVTGVIEFKTPSMPSAFSAAAMLNNDLVSKTWEWREKTAMNVEVPGDTVFQ